MFIQFVILEFVGYAVRARGHMLILFDEDSQCGGDWHGGLLPSQVAFTGRLQLGIVFQLTSGGHSEIAA
jgi:hypothetical protein